MKPKTTKCTYWIARQYSDSPVYNIRAKTRKECVAKVEAGGTAGFDYEKPEKVVIMYDGTQFDLIEQIFTENLGSY